MTDNPLPATPGQLPPLNIRCTSSDCANDLHCFLATKKLREANRQGRCRSCGADLIDWSRVQRRDLHDAAFTFVSLRRELIRHHFWHVPIDQRALNYARRKGRIKLAEAARKRLASSIGPEKPYRDGQQTPHEGSGNPLHYAQHATATCCRRCVEEWHGIPRGRPMTGEEIDYLTALVLQYLEDRIVLSEDGEKVPALRRPFRQLGGSRTPRLFG